MLVEVQVVAVPAGCEILGSDVKNAISDLDLILASRPAESDMAYAYQVPVSSWALYRTTTVSPNVLRNKHTDCVF